MSKGRGNNCRLCLKMLNDDCKVIEEITREIFELLLLKVDLSVSEEPLVCKICMESVQKAFDFKSTCISVEEQVVSLAMDRNSAELDIRDVYLRENENKRLAFTENYNICRFCLQCLEKSNFILFSDLKGNFADDILLELIPELDLNIIKEPMVCAACMKSLESYNRFTMNCRNTEENIMKYREAQGTECKGLISLNNVLKFLFENVLGCSQTAALKDNMYQDELNTYSDINNIVFKIEEEEELIIKDENNYEGYKTEENMCGDKKRRKVVNCNKLTLNNSSQVIMYRCESCTFETKYKWNLTKHMLTHKGNSEVTTYKKCNLCSYKTKLKGYLKNHMLIHKDSSEVVMYRCVKCTFESKYNQCLKNHMLTHKDNSEVTMFKCDLCSFETKWKEYLPRHIMLCHKDSTDTIMYKCASCTFETKCKRYLRNHIILIHKDNSKVSTYKCNLCSYETKVKVYLKRHMMTHKDPSEVVMYRCESCTHVTRRKRSLKRHMLTHKDNSEVTTYKCNTCRYETKWKDYLKRHILTHKNNSEVTVYKCNVCNFETKRKHCLKKHMLSHKKYN